MNFIIDSLVIVGLVAYYQFALTLEVLCFWCFAAYACEFERTKNIFLLDARSCNGFNWFSTQHTCGKHKNLYFQLYNTDVFCVTFAFVFILKYPEILWSFEIVQLSSWVASNFLYNLNLVTTIVYSSTVW